MTAKSVAYLERSKNTLKQNQLSYETLIRYTYSMIDILKQKTLFPLRNFEDVENIFQYNLDPANGEPNLVLLSIVVGLIEHSLVVITDKDDLAANSRPVQHRKDVIQKKFNHANKLCANPSTTTHTASSTHHNHLSSTNNDQLDVESSQDQQTDTQDLNNEANHISSSESECDDDRLSTLSPEFTAKDNLEIPEIEFEIVETLYRKFVDQFKNTIDFKDVEPHQTNLKIKKISDSVWEHLSNSYYKDKAHLQSIFSYLTTSKLDCFGLAFAVIAGCQLLNLKDVYLALSEDHAWVMFDLSPETPLKAQKEREEKEYIDSGLPVPTCAKHGTCEVTWHGKANSDKRGQPVSYKNSWLYTNGYAVKCDIRLCVAALVNSINPSINSNTDSEVLALLQQRLLWRLYERKSYFPMSLGNLGELENLNATPHAPLKPLDLFNMGIEIARTSYNDSHVYPYSYLASYYFNHGRFKEALETWADASMVMTFYNYSRDDEEIYKEFFEVANELLPSMLKILTAGGLEPGRVSDKPILQDPECLALIIKFYDNICCWEEGSSTPVLHIGWAKNFVTTMSRFSFTIRSKLKLVNEDEWFRRDDSNNHVACETTDPCSSTDQATHNTGVSPKQEHCHVDDSADADDASSSSIVTQTSKSNGASSKRRIVSPAEDRVETSEPPTRKIKTDHFEALHSTQMASSPSASSTSAVVKRENRIETEHGSDIVTVILKSRKIIGVRDLLAAVRINKNAIELQLTAQSECAVRGRSNSSSHSSDFISSALLTGGSTRSKRSHR